MTILFFSAQYFPTTGGVERYTYNLAVRAIKKGYHAVVATSALPGLANHERDENGIEIIRLPSWLPVSGRFPVLKPNRELRHQLALLWDTHPDFCLINTRFYPLSVYAAAAARAHHVAAIVVDHSTGHLTLGNSFLDFFGHLYEHAACRFIYHSCPHFYGVSQAVCNWFSHFHIKADGTLHNSIDPAATQKEAHTCEKNWITEYGLSAHTKVVAYVGRIIAEKGVKELVDAFDTLNIPDTALIIAGDGPAYAELSQNPQEHVFFTGNVPHAEAMKLVSQSSVYCLPTRYAEGFPTTTLEAAALKCAVVTTVNGSSTELLADESYGICLPSDYTVPQLASSLQELLQQEDKRTAMAEKAYERLQSHFTWDACFAKLENILLKAQN